MMLRAIRGAGHAGRRWAPFPASGVGAPTQQVAGGARIGAAWKPAGLVRTVIKVTKHSDGAKTATMKQLNEDVLRFHAQGDFTQAMYAADYAIQKARELFGQEHVSLASAYANRGFIAKERGELEDAIELYELSLKVYDKVANFNHGKSIVLQNLGNVLRARSNEVRNDKQKLELRYRAKTVLEDALQIIKGNEGEKSLKYASALQKLANLNRDLGKPAEAESLLRKVISLAKEVDPSSRILFAAKNDLGLALKVQNKSFNEARKLYEDAVEYAQARFGKDHKETIVYMHNLAELLDSKEETKAEANKWRLTILMNDAAKNPTGKH